MDSALLNDPCVDKHVIRPRKNGTPLFHSSIKEQAKKELLAIPNVSEMKRRTRINALEMIEWMEKGLMPYEVKRKMGLKPEDFNAIQSRIKRIVQKYEARKVQELVFYAEIKHNYIYKQCIEAFEQSKTDAKGNKRPGNPIFLQVANETIRDLRKLLGLDKANDLINNGNLNVFNWDSLHSQGNQADTQPGQVAVTAISKVDPIEERIRELERRAAEREQELEETVKKEEDRIDSRIVEISATNVDEQSDSDILFQEDTGEPNPIVAPIVKSKPKLKLKIRESSGKKENVVKQTFDDLCAV